MDNDRTAIGQGVDGIIVCTGAGAQAQTVLCRDMADRRTFGARGLLNGAVGRGGVFQIAVDLLYTIIGEVVIVIITTVFIHDCNSAFISRIRFFRKVVSLPIRPMAAKNYHVVIYYNHFFCFKVICPLAAIALRFHITIA